MKYRTTIPLKRICYVYHNSAVLQIYKHSVLNLPNVLRLLKTATYPSCALLASRCHVGGIVCCATTASGFIDPTSNNARDVGQKNSGTQVLQNLRIAFSLCCIRLRSCVRHRTADVLHRCACMCMSTLLPTACSVYGGHCTYVAVFVDIMHRMFGRTNDSHAKGFLYTRCQRHRSACHPAVMWFNPPVRT